MDVSVIAVDLAKNVFQVHGFSGTAERVLMKRVGRRGFERLMQELPVRCEVVMEACGSAHFWGRFLRSLNYRVRLIPPQHVRAYVVGNKTDGRDTDAIYQASRRRDLRLVPVKTVAQQDALLVHRLRERRKKARVALMNQVRGVLAERGWVCGRSAAALRRLVQEVLTGPATGEVTPYFLEQLALLWEEWRQLDAQVAMAERAIAAHVRATPACQQVLEAAGIGLITASAVVATVGEAQSFRSGRQMAAWIGLTPKEHSSGETRRLGGMTKRGDPYLRTLLIHGARAVVRSALRKDDPRSRWICALVQRRGYNKTVVAVANKNARILWAMLTTGECYRPAAAAVT